MLKTFINGEVDRHTKIMAVNNFYKNAPVPNLFFIIPQVIQVGKNKLQKVSFLNIILTSKTTARPLQCYITLCHTPTLILRINAG